MTARRATIAALLCAVVLTAVRAEPVPAPPRQIKIVRVTDADTITVRYRSGDTATHPVTVRLYGIDAPEADQPGGADATRFVIEWLGRHSVLLREHNMDRYGRIVAEVLIEGSPNARSLNEELVYRGWAWWYREYAGEDQGLAELEARARSEERGLWAHVSPIPPWEWR